MNQEHVAPTFFAIISAARCRSSYVGHLLASHPQVAVHSEIFHQNTPMLLLPDLSKDDLLFDVQWRNNDPDKYLERLIAKTQQHFPHARKIGCKLLLYPYQMNYGLDALLACHPQVIYLTRENDLAWYSSLKIAFETNTWFTKSKLSQQHKITYDPDDFQNQIETQRLFNKVALAKFKEFNTQFLHVEYASLDQQATIVKILDFLNLPSMPLSSEIVEQNSRHILSRFTNPDVVQAYAASIGKLAWIS